MSTHPTYLPKKDTQPWRILKLLSARMPLTSAQVAAELSLGVRVTVQALYLLAHRYGFVYQGKSMSGYLLTKKGHAIARRLGFSGKALGKTVVEDSSSPSPASPRRGHGAKGEGGVKRVGRRQAKRGAESVAVVAGDDDLARIIREQQDSKRKGMRAKRTGTQVPSLPVITGAGAGGAGAGARAFAEKHPDLVKERAACLARVAAIDAYAEACEKLYASSLGG
jgi:hypothetical protein